MGSLFGSSSGRRTRSSRRRRTRRSRRCARDRGRGREPRCARARTNATRGARARDRAGALERHPGKHKNETASPPPRDVVHRARSPTPPRPRARSSPPPSFPPYAPAGDVPRGSVGVRERVRSRGVVWLLARAETRLRRRRRARPRVSALVRAIARRANDPSGADAHTRLRCLQLALTILQRPGGCPSDPAGVASLLTPCFRFLEAAEAELEGGRGGSNPRGSGSLATPSAGSLGGSSAARSGARRSGAWRGRR